MTNRVTKAGQWKALSTVSLIFIVGVTLLSALTRQWVLFAIPIGFLFGFFLQKGDLCGSSAFSEVIMMRDTRKVIGMWALIVVAMVGFAILDLLGWIRLNPKPLLYLNYIVGGVIFGVGMVFAGGCISGCLYKGAAGNLNSIVALLGIPIGVMMVEFGPLNSLHVGMKKYVVAMSDGGRVSLFALAGVPFWLLALVFAIVTVVIAVAARRRRAGSKGVRSDDMPWLERAMTRPWKPWVAGVAIGLLMVPAYLSSAASGRNYPLGVTHGVMQAELLLLDNGFNHVYQAKPAQASTTRPSDNPTPVQKTGGKKVVWWLVALSLSVMLGSWVSARMSGQARLLPKPPDEILFALLGGLLVGIGAAFSTGCVVGNIMSGWALMSVGNIIFGVVVLFTNWATTYFYMMGGQFGK